VRGIVGENARIFSSGGLAFDGWVMRRSSCVQSTFTNLILMTKSWEMCLVSEMVPKEAELYKGTHIKLPRFLQSFKRLSSYDISLYESEGHDVELYAYTRE
jgi:hypothetical protein